MIYLQFVDTVIAYRRLPSHSAPTLHESFHVWYLTSLCPGMYGSFYTTTVNQNDLPWYIIFGAEWYRLIASTYPILLVLQCRLTVDLQTSTHVLYVHV